MWRRRLPRQEPGKPITAYLLNRTAEAAEWATRIIVDAPLAIGATAFGPVLRFAGKLFDFNLAVTGAGGISARAGATAGSGTVSLVTWTSAGGLVTTSQTVTAYNWNSATGGVGATKYGIIAQINGTWWALVFEC